MLSWESDDTTKHPRALLTLSTVLLALFLTSALFTGCGETDGIIGIENHFVADNGLDVGNAKLLDTAAHYVVLNNLELNTEEIGNAAGETVQTTYQLLQVSGLKNAKVEKKVNDRIRQACEELKDKGIPPYRGIRAAITEDYTLEANNINVNEWGNFNNLLSLEVQKYSSYISIEKGISNAEYAGVSDSICLNFDLNTGEEIPLESLFQKGTDGIALIDEAMKEQFSRTFPDEGGSEWYGGVNPGLIGPFQGIKADQQYTLRPDGLNIVLNYKNSEFQTRWFNNEYVFLTARQLQNALTGPQEILAAAKGKSLFVKEEPVRKQLIDGSQGNTEPELRAWKGRELNASLFLQIDKSWPEVLQEKARSMVEFDENQLKQKDLKLPKDSYAEYYESVFCTTWGRLCQMSYSVQYYAPDLQGSPESYYKQRTKVYDRDTLQEVRLADLFVSGYDYKTLLLKRLKEEIAGRPSLYVDDPDSQAEEVLTHLDFEIRGGGLALTGEIPVVRQTEDSNGYEYMHIYIPFEDIGAENFLLFQ